MRERTALAVCLAVIWGGFWAAWLQWTRIGRWLAVRRTWLTVVIGVGMDGLIALLIVPTGPWLRICAIVAASSVGILARSWWNEHTDDLA